MDLYQLSVVVSFCLLSEGLFKGIYVCCRDRARSSANFATQGYGSVVIYHFCKKELQDIQEITQVNCDDEDNSNSLNIALVRL